MDGRAADRARRVHPEHRLAHRAERRREVQLGHHDALEHVGRLADDDGVDVGEGRAPHPPARPRAASRTRPAIETSSRLDLATVWPTPMTAQRSAITHPPGRRPGSAAGTVPTSRAPRRGRPGPTRWPCAASPIRMSPADIIGLAASAPPDGLTPHVVAQSQRVGQDQLLVCVRRVQLGHVDLARRDTPAFSPASFVEGDEVRSRAPDRVRLDPVVDARDERRALAPLVRLVSGREHDGGAAVGQRRQGVLAQRRHLVVLGQQFLGRTVVGHLRLGVRQGRTP